MCVCVCVLLFNIYFSSHAEVPVEMLYVILSIAGIVSIATVILTFFVCLACYQSKQMSKKAKLIKQATKVTLMN